MSLEFEAAVLGHGRHAHGQKSFDISGNLDVQYQSAADAHEMVVMAFQFLGEFEGSTIAVGENLDHHTRSFEDCEVAIDAALRQICVESDDVLRRHRVRRLNESIDQATPTR